MVSELNLERLYDEHAEAVSGFLRNLLRDDADARDVLQELFVKLARNPRLLENIESPRGYLLRLSHNQAIDLMRRRAARDKHRDEFAKDRCELFAAPQDPDELEFAKRLAEALGELPAEQRAVVHLKLWEKLTFEQIAATLDISQGTAASRYRYAIDKLRAHLRPIYKEIK
jgi:RNA polymerase sigma-70 factor, ECF subfamily